MGTPMADKRVALLENGSATGSAKRWPGGVGVFTVSGTFSGATIKLQRLLPGGSTYVDVGVYTTLTAEGMGGFTLDECDVKVTISGGPPSGIYAYIAPLI